MAGLAARAEVRAGSAHRARNPGSLDKTDRQDSVHKTRNPVNLDRLDKEDSVRNSLLKSVNAS